jgi:putative membrane protein
VIVHTIEDGFEDLSDRKLVKAVGSEHEITTLSVGFQEDTMNFTNIGHRASTIIHLSIGLVFILGMGAKTATGQMKAPTDEQFAAEAATGGMAEVKLGQLAEQKGFSESVKAFGRRMAADHSKAGEELKRVAQEEGMTLPVSISKADQMTYDRLDKLSGAQFDSAYAQAMLEDHRADVAAFEKQASSGSNAALKEFARSTLPTLKDHLKMAEKLSQSTSAATM